MLQDGFYQVKLNGPFGQGVGVVVLEGTTLRGGDDLFVYEGRIGQTGLVGGPMQVDADLTALIYSANSPQRGQKFQVKCAGTSNGNTFQVTGKFPTGELVSVQGSFISRLQFG